MGFCGEVEPVCPLWWGGRQISPSAPSLKRDSSGEQSYKHGAAETAAKIEAYPGGVGARSRE